MKTKRITLRTLFFLSVFIFINSCSKKINTVYVNPPLKNVNIPSSDYSVDCNKENVINLDNGGSIIIPANAFVDGNNKPITDSVEINYREFQDALDIVLTGYPMAYDSGGSQYNFTTAGMFEINGNSNGNPVFIAEGKSIQVNIASQTEGGYNFYELDTIEKKWRFIEINKVKTNEKKLAKLAKLAETPNKPIKPRRLTASSQVIDFKIDYKTFPELATYSGVLWEYSEQNKNPDIKSINWVFDVKWNDIELKPYDTVNGIYRLLLNSESQNADFLVNPVLNKNDFKLANIRFGKKMKEYEKAVAFAKYEEERIQKENDFIRSANISNFGIYNCDIIYKMPNMITLKANFKFNMVYNFDEINQTIFLITSKNKAVISYSKYQWDNFSFSPDEDNQLVAFLPGNKVAVFSKEKFKRLNINAIRNKRNPEIDFEMTTIIKKIENPADLRNLLSSI